MFILVFGMFIAGFACFGYAPYVDGWQSLVFTIGLLLCAGALAIPIHKGRHDRKNTPLQ